MNVEVDTTARALYLRLAAGVVADTVELDDWIVGDADDAGRLLGIEFVRPMDFAPFLRDHPELVELPARLSYVSLDRGGRFRGWSSPGPRPTTWRTVPPSRYGRRSRCR